MRKADRPSNRPNNPSEAEAEKMPKFVYLRDDVLICNEQNRVVAIYHPIEPLPHTRNQTHKMPHTSRFPTTEEYLQVRELERAYKANKGI